MTPPPAPVAINPYHESSLIFVMTTPPERSSKLAPRWKGPFFVKRVPNAYQVTYEDDLVWRTVHVNHVKPAKVPTGYLARSFQRPQPRPPIPPQPAAPAAEPTQPAAPAAEPTQPAAAPRAATPPSSRPTTRSSANQNSASRSEPRSPATPGRANDNSRMGQPLRRSVHLNPTACTIKSQPQPASAQSRGTPKMARTYPLSLSYGTCLGHLEDPYSFSSLYLEDLHNGQKTYISQGVSSGLNPGHQFLLNQPPLPQSPPSQPPHLPRVGPPHAHQPIKIRLPALSHGHQPLLGEPMTIRGWVNHCGALHASTPRLAL